MAYLTNFLSVVKPTGLWESIIYWIESGIQNYGWTIILFTLLIKIVLSPLDFYIKYSSRKSTLIQKKLAPQVEKINKKYANNTAAIQNQTNALYKKEGYNVLVSCLVMLGNLIITLVIFIGIFASLRNISAYKVINQYEMLNTKYEELLGAGKTEEQINKGLIDYYNSDVKDSFLWVKNIWRADTWEKAIPTYSELKTMVKDSDAVYKTAVNDISEQSYEKVMAPIRAKNVGWNGYLILAVLVAVLSFISQIISSKTNELTKDKSDLNNLKKSENPAIATTQQTMKIMQIVLPLIMVIFVFQSSAAFGLYLLTSSFISIIITTLTNLGVYKLTSKLEQETKMVLEKQVKKLN